MSILARGHEADICDFRPHQFSLSTTCEATFCVRVLYISPSEYEVVVYRTDLGDKEVPEPIHVLVLQSDGQAQNVCVGPCLDEARARVQTTYIIEPAVDCPEPPRPPRIGLPPPRQLQKLMLDEFNEKFATDIAQLPSSLYAIGATFCEGIHEWFVYNEKFDQFYNMVNVAQLILRVREFRKLFIYDELPFYFILSACDGYGENTYFSAARTTPLRIRGPACSGVYNFAGYTETEYPVYHARKHIVAQSSHQNMPYVINTIDRHYLYHNLYNSFRSFHRGIRFEDKIPMLVFGARSICGSRYNFVHSKHIYENPRDYFRHTIAPMHPFVHCPDEWITREEQVCYKYVLDIDGNASTYDATAWKLNSNSVIFKPESGWTQWFYDEYCIPEKFFIQIKDDFSDLAEKFAWCEAHPEECQRMTRNCRALFQRIYSMPAIIDAVSDVVLTLAHAESYMQ